MLRTQIYAFSLKKEKLEAFDRRPCNAEALLETLGHLNCEHIVMPGVSRRKNFPLRSSNQLVLQV